MARRIFLLGVDIDLSGHKATIESMSVRLAVTDVPILGVPDKDRLLVLIEFEKAVGSILGFAVHLPVRAYGKAEFLSLVKKVGEVRLKECLEEERESRYREEGRAVRERDLEGIASGIKREVLGV